MPTNNSIKLLIN